MKLLQRTTFLAIVLTLALSAYAQDTPPTTAPKLSGFAVQGTTVNLEAYKGKQNVLVVFYRTYD